MLIYLLHVLERSAKNNIFYTFFSILVIFIYLPLIKICLMIKKKKHCKQEIKTLEQNLVFPNSSVGLQPGSTEHVE